MKVLWYIQKNLNSDDKKLVPFLEELNQPYRYFNIVPFIYNIPDHNYNGPVIVRGTTTTLKTAEKKNWKPGVWINDNFKPSYYKYYYNDLFLNKHGFSIKLKEIIKDMEEYYFVRPNSDYKELTGSVLSNKELLKIKEEAKLGKLNFNDNLTLFIAKPLKIINEARFVIVDNKILSGYYYRYMKKLKNFSAGPDFYDIVEKAIDRWKPADVYCLDIGQTEEGEIGVIECNCFNGSGIYGGYKEIVKGISIFVENNFQGFK